MTKQKKHKQRVRARMRATGENFTKANRHVEANPPQEEGENALFATYQEVPIEFDKLERFGRKLGRHPFLDDLGVAELSSLQELWDAAPDVSKHFSERGPKDLSEILRNQMLRSYFRPSPDHAIVDEFSLDSLCQVCVRVERCNRRAVVVVCHPHTAKHLLTLDPTSECLSQEMEKSLRSKVGDEFYEYTSARGIVVLGTLLNAYVISNPNCDPHLVCVVDSNDRDWCLQQRDPSLELPTLEERREVAIGIALCARPDIEADELDFAKLSWSSAFHLPSGVVIASPKRWEALRLKPGFGSKLRLVDEPDVGLEGLGPDVLGTLVGHTMLARENWPDDVILVVRHGSRATRIRCT
jgi:hypothetical protein